MTKAEAKQLVEQDPKRAAEIIVTAYKLQESVLHSRPLAHEKYSQRTENWVDSLRALLGLDPCK